MVRTDTPTREGERRLGTAIHSLPSFVVTPIDEECRSSHFVPTVRFQGPRSFSWPQW